MSEHSPTPWKIIRYHVPYGDWIMSADSGVVAGLFGYRDERLLLHAPLLLSLCELAADALGEGALADEMRAVIGVVRGDAAGAVGIEPTIA